MKESVNLSTMQKFNSFSIVSKFDRQSLKTAILWPVFSHEPMQTFLSKYEKTVFLNIE